MTSTEFPGRTAPVPGPDDEPAWWRQRRSVALERARSLSAPTDAEEVWRYSRIGDLDLAAFPVLEPSPRGAPGAAAEPIVAELRRAATVRVVDGRVVDIHARPGVPERVTIGRLLDHPDAQGLLASVEAEATDLFAELGSVHGADPVVVDVPDGVEVPAPIVVEIHSSAVSASVFPRLIVRIGPGARATVLEHHTSGPDPVLVVARLDALVGTGGGLRHGVVQTLGPAAWMIADQIVRAESSAEVHLATAALGGYTARTRTDCRLVGRGSSADLSALYFAAGDQMHDFRTFQEHRAADTSSNLLFKGVLDDRARSVYTGLIRIHPEARGSTAFQTNRNLKLSDDAWAESVPNLEIECRDVRCSHASTVGPLDEEQQFYLASRGVPPAEAERLMVNGFFEDVIVRFPVDEARDPLRALVRAELERRREAVDV